MRTEKQMSRAVARSLGRYACHELKVGDCIFDVVAYDKKEKLFRVVECKRSSKASRIGKTFGQLSAYRATIAARGREFLDAYSKKIPVTMRLERWMEATDYYRHFRVALYVALTERACKRFDLIRSLKELLPGVGVIRVKPNGLCRHYLRKGKLRDEGVAQARPVMVRILRRSASR
jgi:hypothetical protein